MITERVDREQLESITFRAKTVFSPAEEIFLQQYSPLRFGGESYREMCHEENARKEANQRVFDVVVKLDISACRVASMERLYAEKTAVVNPFLEAEGIGAVTLYPDHLKSILELKLRGIEFLRRTVDQNEFPTVTRRKESNAFHQEVEELREVLGNVPMVVYGSALKKDAPPDIDMVAFPSRIDLDLYQRIRRSYDPKRKPLLSCVIFIPESIKAYTLSDTYNVFDPERSKVVNGEVTFPIVNTDYWQELKMYNAAQLLLDARESLTPKGIDECHNLPRINARLKLPKFFYMRLSEDLVGVPEPTVTSFDHIPPREELVEALIEANLAIVRVFQEYAERKQK